MSEFSNKVVYVSGGAGNLGQAVAKTFLDKGATVIALDIDEAALKAAYIDAPDLLSTYVIDLTDPIACEFLSGRLEQENKIADILCALTGGFSMGDPVHETPSEIFNRLFELNVQTLFTLVSACVPHMKANGGGKIITIGADAALNGLPNMGAYCASKSAVMRLTESMSAELKSNGFNINCILPTIINTPQNRASMPGTDPKDWETPESIANLICHLSSDAAEDIHGQMVRVGEQG
ncbi:MAG: SDR family NAD(P)-dependent oxidoreductase [Rhodospirillales bacterium]|jgi:NAD(P)-dependent dehydrogenase (short-subunit alcohol dehydrogenase family)